MWEEYIDAEKISPRSSQTDHEIHIIDNKEKNAEKDESIIDNKEKDEEKDESIIDNKEKNEEQDDNILGWFDCEWCGKKARLPRSEHDDDSGHMSLILPRLHIGAAWNACNARELQSGNIGVIVSMASELGQKLFANTIEYRHYSLEDDQREFAMPIFVDAAHFIAEKLQTQERSVLVHCFLGKSRSVSAVLTYLLSIGFSTHQALSKIREHRPFAKPNDGYLSQLKALEILYRNLFYNTSLIRFILAYCSQNGLNH